MAFLRLTAIPVTLNSSNTSVATEIFFSDLTKAPDLQCLSHSCWRPFTFPGPRSIPTPSLGIKVVWTGAQLPPEQTQVALLSISHFCCPAMLTWSLLEPRLSSWDTEDLGIRCSKKAEPFNHLNSAVDPPLWLSLRQQGGLGRSGRVHHWLLLFPEFRRGSRQERLV